MTGYLLDTNVVSEFTKRSPHPSVMDFLDAHDDLWLSAIVIEELDFGIRLLPDGRRRRRLRDWSSQIKMGFRQRILPIEIGEAEWAATFRAQADREGRKLRLADALIAATAKTRDLAIATRNVKDFAGTDVDIFDPWQPS